MPFLVGIAVLKGLTVEIDTFHGSDARVYHLPTILRFAHELPGVDLTDYPAAQTPLFHLLMALWGKLVGFELWRLRLLNVAISYAAVLALYRLLSRELRLGRTRAFALALLFALSPYFFGASFTLLTDNLGLLFGVLALIGFQRTAREGSLRWFGAGCLAMGAAVLTRQSFLWLAPVALWASLSGPLGVRHRLAGVGLVGAALAPFAALAVAWGALVPPSSDPTSCGLCADRAGLRGGLSLRPVVFSLALLGLYGGAIWGPPLLRRARELRPHLPSLAAALAAGAALLAISRLHYRPVVPGRGGDAGYLWQVSHHLPDLAGSSLLYWALVPLGALALALLLPRAGLDSLPAVYVASFLVGALPVRLGYQKYFDPYVLLALAMLVRRPDLRSRLDYAGLAALAVAFVAYALSFAG